MTPALQNVLYCLSLIHAVFTIADTLLHVTDEELASLDYAVKYPDEFFLP